jgi:phenylacetic acid degradation operon negative regulatory protein
MPKKESTLANALLFSIYAAGAFGEQALKFIFTSPYQWRHRALYGRSYSSYKNTVYNLKKRGVVDIISKDGKRFLKLTKKGELEVLLAKARLPIGGNWDGKWRIIIFDIPEDAKLLRDQLRGLLKRNNFKKLQASVYINPYPLNREAVSYLKQTGLLEYIRIIKVEEMDEDRDLKKKFSLK